MLHQWWLAFGVFWKVVAAIFLLGAGLHFVWAHIHVKPVLQWVAARVFPRPHTPQPDAVRFEVLYSSTPTSIKFEWKRQVIHLWGKNGTLRERIWERFASPREIIVQAGNKEFVGLLPGTSLHVFPTIRAKTGIVAWDENNVFGDRDYPYPEPVSAATPTSGTAGGSICPLTHLSW
jgi:hypothetical protein